MDKIFGLRVAEHTMYSRSLNNLSQNDQSYGVQLHYNKDKWEIGANYFIGNLTQDKALRQKGFSLKLDFKPSNNSAIGGSYLSSKNNFVKQTSMAIHLISSIGKGSSLLAEIGKISFSPVIGNTKDTKYTYGMSQIYFKLSRGLYFFNQIELLESSDVSSNLRFGPGLQYFPMQRVEVRAEIYNTRNFSKKVSNEDSWDILGQLHLWL